MQRIRSVDYFGIWAEREFKGPCESLRILGYIYDAFCDVLRSHGDKQKKAVDVFFSDLWLYRKPIKTTPFYCDFCYAVGQLYNFQKGYKYDLNVLYKVLDQIDGFLLVNKAKI